MATLYDRTIASSYTELLKTTASAGLTSSLTVVEDGDATQSALQISTLLVRSSGDFEVAGTSSLTGNVSLGGDLTVAGNAVIQGTLTANGGTLTLGDANTDNVVFNADINSHIVPDTTNVYDLGSASQEWRNLYVDGTGFIDSITAESITATISQTISATTQSTNKDTGALVVEGGVGVEKNLNIGGNVVITGNLQVAGTTTIYDPTATPSEVYWSL